MLNHLNLDTLEEESVVANNGGFLHVKLGWGTDSDGEVLALEMPSFPAPVRVRTIGSIIKAYDHSKSKIFYVYIYIEHQPA